MKKNNLILAIFTIFVILGFQITQVEASVRILPSPSVLPTARGMTTAIWDGNNAYIFGGWDTWFLDDIVRFNPSTGTVTLLPSPSVLPTPSWWTSAIWDGSNAYIFGGDNTGHGVPKWNWMNYIVQFNPTTGTVYVLSFPDILPTGRGVTSAIWDGRNAYIFGGSDDYSDALNDIVLFSPPEPLIGKRSAVVGGFMTPANKLAILAPYMTLLIFFEITLAIYIIRLKRKP
jgi:hypothetical protein